MKSLRDHVVENANAARGEKRRRNREATADDVKPAGEAGDVREIRSLGLDAATVALPAGNRSQDAGGADKSVLGSAGSLSVSGRGRRRCVRVWRALARRAPCPLYPRKRTCAAH